MGLCGNETARGAFVRALYSFSLLGTRRLLEHCHVRCVQDLLCLARSDEELLGTTWEHIFCALSEGSPDAAGLSVDGKEQSSGCCSCKTLAAMTGEERSTSLLLGKWG